MRRTLSRLMHWTVVVATFGGVFQVAGIFLVFIQIRSAERLLGAVSWVSKVGGWLKARLPIRRNVVLTPVGASLAVTYGVARITVQRNRGTTVDERLESLQLQMDDARRELDELWTRSTADRAEFERKAARIESSLKALDAEIRGLIADLTIGSRHLQVFGAVLIIIGTIFITASPFLP
jgi:hypothetical protein